ncbi:MAG: thiamine pyrophosphate-dependent enzyme [Blastochloris sp.]|nr:thiamine pyrophosphate-dependent enzyme [Blastochloris sp.]
MSRLKTAVRLKLLETMFQSREGDRREGILFRQGQGWFQISSMGHEALIALSLHLRASDYLFPHYRDRCLVLGRGVTTRELASIFYAKRDSTSGGRQLPGHYSSRKHNICSLASPTASNLLPACGAAWGMVLDGNDDVAMACVGDAGMRQGEFYEAYAFAVERNLPVIFVVEDNQYGISSCTTDSNPLRNQLFDQKRVLQVNGRCIDDLQAASSKAIQQARSGQGPSILWCELDRLASHSSSDDHRIYRSPEDLEQILARDPITVLSKQLIEEGILTEEKWQKTQNQIIEQVEADYRKASESSDPKQAEVMEQLLGEAHGGLGDTVNEGCSDWRMLDAVNETFKQALDNNRRYVFFGEDICDPMGGVFKLTNGLSTKFPDRVFNSPLAEATIVGVACGLAAYGYRPVFELQFIDFVGPAWNQLVNNLATLRWRTFGEWTAPVVLYAPYGAYLPAGGPWHSQANEAAFAHVPGLRVVVPSTPEDAAGLMQTALKAEDPTIVLLPKHLLRVRRPRPSRVEAVPFQQAILRSLGEDVTVVCWGNCVEKVMEAVQELGGINSVELVDLRSISPWDKETVKESVLKTGRLLVVQEDNITCSAGQMIISDLLQDSDVWAALRCSPRLLSRPDIHIGFHPVYEESVLPDKARILQALLDITEGGQTKPSRQGSASHSNLQDHGADSANGQLPIRVPHIGEGLEEARIIKFFKQPGDKVKRDELIYQLETDKAVVDIESPQDGFLSSWEAAESSIVRIGSIIGHIQTTNSPTSTKSASAKVNQSVPKSASNLAPSLSSSHIGSPTASTRQIAPLQSTMLAKTAAELAKQVEGADFEEITLSAQQQVLATRLVRAARVAVPATIFQDASWELIKKARESIKGDPEKKEITSFAIFAWCVAQAVKLHPVFRSSLPQNSIMRVYRDVHLGVAVSLPNDDMTTAVLEGADTLNLLEFSRKLRRQVELAREGVDQARQPASLILTSMASFNIPHGIPVIVPPAVATLLLSAPQKKVVLQGTTPVNREFINLSLTIDHRVMNGSSAGAFLNEVKKKLEEFELRPEMF